MHSFDRYNGANNRITLPNRCRVKVCDLWHSASSLSCARRRNQLRKIPQ